MWITIACVCAYIYIYISGILATIINELVARLDSIITIAFHVDELYMLMLLLL